MSSFAFAIFSFLLLQPSHGKVVEFDRDRFTVWFEPWIFPGDKDIKNPYGEADLIKMTATVSSKFSKVIIRDIPQMYNEDQSDVMIPSAVAKFNKLFKKPNERPVEVTMTYYTPRAGSQDMNVNPAKIIADKANAIFNGTVKVLMLRTILQNQQMENIIQSLRNVRAEIDKDTNYYYKLGAYLSLEDCSRKDYLNRVLEFADIVIFYKWSSSASLSYTLTTYFKHITLPFEDCLKSLTPTQRQVEYGFFTEISDKPPYHNRSLPHLVNFWEKMNSWAVEKKTNVVLFEAFDNFPRGELDKWSGWWRGRNGENGKLLDFQLEEKATVMDLPPPNITESTFNGFDRDHFIVQFDPWVAPGDYEVRHVYSEQDLLNMITKISTQFRRISIAESDTDKLNKGSTESILASSVATWNKNHRDVGTLPIQVEMYCTIDPLNVVGRTRNEIMENCDIIKNLADNANSIYPGTVKDIVIRFHYLSPGNLYASKDHLTYAKGFLQEGQYKYKLGLQITDIFCTKNGFSNLKDYLDIADILTIKKYPTSEDFNIGVQTAFPKLFKEVERCISIIRGKHGNVSIRIRTSWPETWDTSLGEFWKMANKWAVAENVTVDIAGAFDAYKRAGDGLDRSGWWTLDKRRRYSHPSEYVFLEKTREDQKENGSDGLPVPEGISVGKVTQTVITVNNDNTLMIVIVTAGCLLLLEVVAIVGLFAYRKYVRREFGLSQSSSEMANFLQ